MKKHQQKNKQADILSKEQQSDNESFTNSIMAFSKNLETEKVNKDLQDHFLKLAEKRNTLPPQSKTTLIDQFLTIVISLVTYNQYTLVASRALKILFEFLKNDTQVFARFKPNKLILRKMEIAQRILSPDDIESELYLDFTSFLLRYNRDIDYSDFSDDIAVQNKIKRAESFRSWADIEDLAHGFENLSENFNNHRTTAGNAFHELYQFIEKTKKELQKPQSQAVHHQNSNQNHDHDAIPRIIRDKKTDSINIEDTLVDYMEIIISLNAKINNHINSTKISFKELEVGIEKIQNSSSQNYQQSYLNQLKPKNIEYDAFGKIDQLKLQQRLTEQDTELERLRLEVLAQRQNDKIRQEEMESFFKKASLEYFQKLKDVQSQFDKIKPDQYINNHIVNKLQLMEQEVVDLKNQNKARIYKIGEQATSATGFGIIDGNKRLDLLIEEINQLWSFIQRFIDEQSVDMIQDVMSVDKPMKDKMNRMDWLARNAEFLSPDQITKCLIAFKDQFNNQPPQVRNQFISANHTSNAIITVINLIDHASFLNRDEETISRLAILLSIFEPLLINDLNLERALETSIIKTLINLLELPKHIIDGNTLSEAENVKLPIFIKYAIRCLTSCVRHPNGVDSLVFDQNGVVNILQFIQVLRDEEIIANSAKILRIVLREEKHYEKIINKHTEIGNLLLETLRLFQYSEIVQTELLAGCRNFSRSIQAASMISANNCDVLLPFCMNPPSAKIQNLAIDCVRNLMKILEHDRIFKQLGGYEMLILLGDQNKFEYK